ncbi:prestin isoform X1 [Hydra vulgaris]|uniref:prestin isoform X1 n=1 Tax=Hydra vulgaris TaxID=6087 RepID=UPI001F5F2B27|nr:sulfate transporter-like [Hydra vulgaris]
MDERKFLIHRQVYTEEVLNHFRKNSMENQCSIDVRIRLYKFLKNIKKRINWRNALKFIFSFFPVLTWLPKYDIRKDLSKDLSSGLTLGVLQVPQGLAYAMLSTLPAVYGLYTSFTPSIVYFIMGSSRHLCIGTFAVTSLMVGKVVQKQMVLASYSNVTAGLSNSTSAENDINLRLQYAVTVSFFVGILQITLAMLRFDIITSYLSDPLISGYTTGAACHVFSSQLKHMLGMEISADQTQGLFSLFKLYYYVSAHIKLIKLPVLLLGTICVIILLLTKFVSDKFKLKIPIPAELILVILGTSLSYAFKFETKFQIPILKNVPKGFPPLTMPLFSMMGDIILDCFIIAVVSFAINISIAKAFAKKQNCSLSPNQELYAYGVVNIVGSFFSCFYASGSLSRSAIQYSLGSTQLANLISSLVVLLAMVVLASYFQPLPNAILAAIVWVALKGIFKQVYDVKLLWKVSKVDAFIWISSFVAVVCFDVDIGLAIAIGINITLSVIRASRPSYALLQNFKETEIYIASSGKTFDNIPGVKIFQYRAPLFYANVEHFQNSLYKSTIHPNFCTVVSHDSTNWIESNCDNEYFKDYPDENPKKLLIPENSSDEFVSLLPTKEKLLKRSVHTIIIDCSQISYIDSMGLNILLTISRDFKQVGVDFFICNCQGNVLETLENGGYINENGLASIFVTVHDAVQTAIAKEHVNLACKPTDILLVEEPRV